MPKVSVIVPVYNVEKYLRECLESLVNQTLNDIEIICINDGSKDSSPKILDEYAQKDNRIKLIHKKNTGYGASMNLGLDTAKGEYIGIVESDDLTKNTMFENLYKLAKENSADVVKSDFYYFFSKANIVRQAGKINKKYEGKVLNIKDIPAIIKMQPSIWSAIYKKSFLIENNIRFLETSGASYQDTSFAFKTLISAKRLIFTTKAYLYYRQDNENSSVKSKKKIYSICDEWQEITKFLNERPELKEFVNQIKLSTQFNAYKANAMRIDESFRDEFIECYRKTFKEFYENGEIKKQFYSRIGQKKELKLLLNDEKGYRKLIDRASKKKLQLQNRRKMFSVHINSTRISIILFGKQILERAYG